ncbi:MAG: zinc ribbon domain-containing protein [Acetivibrionales bacterium]|jgi:hypothetical protein|nr:zinc ribbon domain-containing protein [Clostridiaceae bacterium]
MAFLDDIKRFGKNITEKGKDAIEITKLNSQIGAEKDKIKDLYLKIGEAVYRAYVAGETTGYEELCAQIRASEDVISELNDKVLELKNSTKCSNCGNEVPKDTAFCSKCGTKVGE